MRIITVLALLGCLCACGDPEAPKTLDASKELRPHFEKVYAAWGTLDTDKVAPFYSKAPGAVFYDVAPLKYSGWAEFAPGFKKVSADWKAVKIDINPDFKASSNGPMAWATFTANIAIEMKDGKKENSVARLTELLQKDKGNWLIIHEHVSMPMMEAPKPPPAAKKAATKKKTRRRR